MRGGRDAAPLVCRVPGWSATSTGCLTPEQGPLAQASNISSIPPLPGPHGCSPHAPTSHELNNRCLSSTCDPRSSSGTPGTGARCSFGQPCRSAASEEVGAAAVRRSLEFWAVGGRPAGRVGGPCNSIWGLHRGPPGAPLPHPPLINPSPAGFGASSSPFGATAPSPFGQQTPAFGQAPAASPFGATATHRQRVWPGAWRRTCSCCGRCRPALSSHACRGPTLTADPAPPADPARVWGGARPRVWRVADVGVWRRQRPRVWCCQRARLWRSPHQRVWSQARVRRVWRHGRGQPLWRLQRAGIRRVGTRLWRARLGARLWRVPLWRRVAPLAPRPPRLGPPAPPRLAPPVPLPLVAPA